MDKAEADRIALEVQAELLDDPSTHRSDRGDVGEAVSDPPFYLWGLFMRWIVSGLDEERERAGKQTERGRELPSHVM